MTDFNIILIFNLVPDLINKWIIKLDHLPGIFENKMIMLFIKGCFLKLRIVCPKLMLCNKSAIQ